MHLSTLRRGEIRDWGGDDLYGLEVGGGNREQNLQVVGIVRGLSRLEARFRSDLQKRPSGPVAGVLVRDMGQLQPTKAPLK